MSFLSVWRSLVSTKHDEQASPEVVKAKASFLESLSELRKVLQEHADKAAEDTHD